MHLYYHTYFKFKIEERDRLIEHHVNTHLKSSRTLQKHSIHSKYIYSFPTIHQKNKFFFYHTMILGTASNRTLL